MQKMRYFDRQFQQRDLPVDEQRKRQFLALFLLTGLPALLLFGVSDLLTNGFRLGGGLAFLALLVGLINFAALRYLKSILFIFRLGLAVVLLILAVHITTGGGAGVAFLWLYFHPLAVFFLFGKKEGRRWVVGSWLVSFALMILNLGAYHYESAVGLRFMVTYTLVCILAYGLESSRGQYYDQLLAEKAALEDALQQVKTLRGLLPICAACKNIRDDEGYWHQVETYLRRHTQVEFSHSICPACRRKLYPTLANRVAAATSAVRADAQPKGRVP